MRELAGRPKGVRESVPRQRKLSKRETAERIARMQQAGVLAGTARQVLAALGDSRYWLEVIGRLEDEMDYKTIAGVLQFQQSMRDGRPAQQINVTSFGVQVTADDVAKARAIARELAPIVRREHLANTIESTPNALEGRREEE